jgi:hypothetical protein
MIKLFKLLNGEEFIAEIDDDDDLVDGWCEREVLLKMRKPLRVLMTNQGMMLSPYPCNCIFVLTSHILLMGEVIDQLLSVYRDATGGIAVPPQGLQLPN